MGVVEGENHASDGLAPAARHVSRRIREARLRERPFPHLVVDDAFPGETYAAILRETATSMPVVSPFRRGPRREGLHLDLERGNFWQKLYRLLASEVKDAAVDRLRETLRPGLETDQLRLRECTVVRDRFGYQIPPHSDSPKLKAITMLLYLPRSARFPHLGTCLCVPKASAPPIPANEEEYDWQAWRDFEIVERIDFVPNRLVLFAVTPHSFHCVRRVWLPVSRDSLQAFIA
jgi:hypothetical protein